MLYLFHRQFFIAKVDFLPLCEKLKNNYLGTNATGFQYYTHAQQQGYNSNPKSGPITMEIKLAITLRLLRGACALDMIWYGVQIQSVAVIFSFVMKLLLELNEVTQHGNHLLNEVTHRTTSQIKKDITKAI